MEAFFFFKSHLVCDSFFQYLQFLIRYYFWDEKIENYSPVWKIYFCFLFIFHSAISEGPFIWWKHCTPEFSLPPYSLDLWMINMLMKISPIVRSILLGYFATAFRFIHLLQWILTKFICLSLCNSQSNFSVEFSNDANSKHFLNSNKFNQPC